MYGISLQKIKQNNFRNMGEENDEEQKIRRQKYRYDFCKRLLNY